MILVTLCEGKVKLLQNYKKTILRKGWYGYEVESYSVQNAGVAVFSLGFPGENRQIRLSRACINVCQRFITPLLDTSKGHQI